MELEIKVAKKSITAQWFLSVFLVIAAVVTVPPFQLCPSAAVSVCAVRIVPHTEHLLPSVFPPAVHVAATAGIATGVCAVFGIASV